LINAAQLGAVIHTFAITKQRVLEQPDSLGFSDTKISTDLEQCRDARCANGTAYSKYGIRLAVDNVKMACLPSNPGCKPDACSKAGA
jgi:hypothetical protein